MSWFSNLRTAMKLVVSYAVLLVFLVTTGVLGLSAASEAGASLETTYKRDLLGLDLDRRCEIGLLMVHRFLRGALLAPEESRAKYVADMEAADVTLRKDLEELESTLIVAENKARVAEVRRQVPELVAQAHEAVRLASSDPKRSAAVHAAYSQGMTLAVEALHPIVTTKKELARTSFEASVASYQRARNLVVTTLLAAIAAGILLAVFGARAIANPLEKAVSVLEKVAAGDLSVRLDVDQTDEVGRMAVALNRTLEAIHRTMVHVNAVSVEVSSASAELASSAQQISSGAQEQAASLEETAASLEQISSTVKQNTDNAQHASQLASGARDAAERGGEVVKSAVLAMTEITRASKKIADIITTIDEIAFQTNLLALNAAVEAARAGEQGRGFGVVAAEVRSLAQRTATAAKEIRGLIADSGSKVEVGTQQVNESGETLVEIVMSVKRVTDMVAEIAAASREQNTGLDQVNTAVTQVDQVTQLNASQTEELSATATALSDKSAELQRLVDAFQLGGDGPAPVAKTPPRRAAPAAKAGASRRRGAREMSVRQPVLAAASGVEEF